MSAKECDHHEQKRRILYRRICAGILVLLVLILFTILIIWAVLKPHKPAFILQDANIYAFNQSSPNLLTTTFQVTLVSRNPNDKIGVYYDRLKLFATYRNQQITLSTAVPPTYQGHKEIDVWSPFLFGNQVPVSPENHFALSQDRANGAVWIMIKGDGRVRFKVGSFISGSYRLFVECQTYIRFSNNGYSVKLMNFQRCKVNV